MKDILKVCKKQSSSLFDNAGLSWALEDVGSSSTPNSLPTHHICLWPHGSWRSFWQVETSICQLPLEVNSEPRKSSSSWELCLLWAKWGSCVWTYWANLLLWMTPPSGEEPSTLLDPQAAGSGCRTFCTFQEPFWHKNSRERELLILMFKILTLR